MMNAVTVVGLGTMTVESNEISSDSASAVLPKCTSDTSVVDSFLMTTNDGSNSTMFGSSCSFFNKTQKALFTISSSSSEILVVNNNACQLLSYSSNELCSIKLEELIYDSYKTKWCNLKKSFLDHSASSNCSKETMVELVSGDSSTILVSLWLKKLDSPLKCLAIVEPIDIKKVLISIDQYGKILCCDDEATALFQYYEPELVGANIFVLFPAINFKNLFQLHTNATIKQYTTGRTKSNKSFPVCLNIRQNNINAEIFDILVWSYLSLKGLIVLKENLHVKKCNHSFVKLFFGCGRKKVVNEPIATFIPTFSQALKVERSKKNYFKQDLINYGNKSHYSNSLDRSTSDSIEKSLFCLDSADNLMNSSSCSLTNNLGYEPTDEPLRDNKNDFKFKTLFNSKPTSYSGNKSFKNRIPLEGKQHAYSETKYESEISEESDIEEHCDNYLISGVSYASCGLHSDGTYMDIKYHVKKVISNDGVNYWVWLSSDIPKSTSKNEFNISETSSVNSKSIDSFFTGESNFSEQFSRPNSASIFSHSDEVLAAGEYSQHYTNLTEINKKDCNCVKMAFRNSDQLLVITKFIKKRKINSVSWVFNSNLHMKIPLEINFLLNLHHPNIVKVLDVFQNDFFVQLVMEKHGAGLDLFEFIDRGLKCDEKLKSYIFRQIISAVHYLHSLGIIHRDIKDENIIINEKFEVKLIDFGSAAFISSEEGFTKFYGTFEYCSPEVLQGNSYRGPELEVWALGVTLYILNFGENPFCDVEETIKGEFSILTPISDELNALLHRMLDKNVSSRITIEELVQNNWINQPICIENYKFDEVVCCSEYESHPAKYVYEIPAKGCYEETNLTRSRQLSEFTHGYSSIQNSDLDTLSDIEEKFFEISKFTVCKKERALLPIISSSTPMKKPYRRSKSAHL